MKLIRHILGVEVYADKQGNEFVSQPDGSLVAANSEPRDKVVARGLDALKEMEVHDEAD